MTRGFTLIELLITLSVFVLILSFAVPSFSSVSDAVKMRRLASELSGFLVQAKSEAIKRNVDLRVMFSFASDDPQSTGNWSLKLVDPSDNEILFFDGTSFKGITVKHNYASAINDPLPVKFEKIRGRPNPGGITFHPFNNTATHLKASLSNPPGRVKICSMNTELYDYPHVRSLL
nr:GspH/FimT family pseudopilin [Vibrio mexicanus]